jgi:hypothetical protein
MKLEVLLKLEKKHNYIYTVAKMCRQESYTNSKSKGKLQIRRIFVWSHKFILRGDLLTSINSEGAGKYHVPLSAIQ